jgi:hypothetical protein
MEKKKAYVVTYEYMGYGDSYTHTKEVFDTKEKAEEYCKNHNTMGDFFDSYNWEEFEIK